MEAFTSVVGGSGGGGSGGGGGGNGRVPWSDGEAGRGHISLREQASGRVGATTAPEGGGTIDIEMSASPSTLTPPAHRPEVGRCRLTVSKPVLKAPMVSALETRTRYTAFNFCFQIQLASLHRGHADPARVATDERQGLTLVHCSAQRKHILLDTLGA
jgi:hypothetical protein